MRQKITLILLMSAVGLVTGAVALKRGNAQESKPEVNPPTSKPTQVIHFSGPIIDPERIERDRRQGALHNQALKLLHQKKWRLAQIKLQEAIAVDPHTAIPPLYAGLARALEEQGRSREAIIAMRKAFFGPVRGLESHPEALLQYASLAEKVGLTKDAQRAYAEAVAAGSTNNNDFKKGISNNPSLSQIKALAHVAAGQESHRNSDDASAELLFRKALSIDPKCALAHLNLATTLRLVGTPPKIKEAALHFDQAAKLGIPNPWTSR